MSEWSLEVICGWLWLVKDLLFWKIDSSYEKIWDFRCHKLITLIPMELADFFLVCSHMDWNNLRDVDLIRHWPGNVILSGEIWKSNTYFIPSCAGRAVCLMLEIITIWIQSRKQISWMQQRSFQIISLTQRMWRLFVWLVCGYTF